MKPAQRPWGCYDVLYLEEAVQLKKIIVQPGKRLSLQSHEFRAEHWFILSGTGRVELNGISSNLSPGDSIDIPIGAKHRIGCTSDSPLVFIEVQTGSSFDEGDIIRYSDDFGRESR
jgi:mannose-6-phosphate isomerase